MTEKVKERRRSKGNSRKCSKEQRRAGSTSLARLDQRFRGTGKDLKEDTQEEELEKVLHQRTTKAKLS